MRARLVGGVADRVGDQSYGGGGVGEVFGQGCGEYLVPVTVGRGVVGQAWYDAGIEVVGLVVVGCEVGEVGIHRRDGFHRWVCGA